MIIEFFGLPFSGKTTITEKIKKLAISSKKISNYRELIFYHLYKTKKINFFEHYIFKRLEFSREFGGDRYEKNIFSKIINTLFLRIIDKNKLDKKIDELFNLYKNDYSDYLKFFHEKVNNNTNKSLSLNFEWIKYLIIGHFLSFKYKEFILINSEGFLQICLSLMVRVKMETSDIEKYLNLCPYIDYVFVTVSDKREKKKITEYIKKKNIHFLFDRKFIKKFFLIIKKIRILKGTDMDLGNKKDFYKINNFFKTKINH